MKLLVSLCSLFLLLFTTSFPVSAASPPNISLSVSGNRHYIYVAFTGLTTVSKVNYALTYDTAASVTKGFEGGFFTKRRTTRSPRRQILGTCSSGKCVYDVSPKNFILQATFTLRTGGTVQISRTLP